MWNKKALDASKTAWNGTHGKDKKVKKVISLVLRFLKISDLKE